MAGNLSDYLENKLLDHITGQTAYTKPTVFLALYTVVPTDSTDGTEVNAEGYERKATTGEDWNTATNGSVTNAASFEWDTAEAEWGIVAGAALVDAATGGNILVYGPAQVAKTVETGDSYRVAAGNFTLSMD